MALARRFGCRLENMKQFGHMRVNSLLSAMCTLLLQTSFPFLVSIHKCCKGISSLYIRTIIKTIDSLWAAVIQMQALSQLLNCPVRFYTRIYKPAFIGFLVPHTPHSPQSPALRYAPSLQT